MKHPIWSHLTSLLKFNQACAVTHHPDNIQFGAKFPRVKNLRLDLACFE